MTAQQRAKLQMLSAIDMPQMTAQKVQKSHTVAPPRPKAPVDSTSSTEEQQTPLSGTLK